MSSVVSNPVASFSITFRDDEGRRHRYRFVRVTGPAGSSYRCRSKRLKDHFYSVEQAVKAAQVDMRKKSKGHDEV